MFLGQDNKLRGKITQIFFLKIITFLLDINIFYQEIRV